MIKSYLTSTQVASSVPFDNATNGFTATNVQAAIEEGRYKFQYYSATSTTSVSRTANTFTPVSSMSITPVAGTYLCLWSCEMTCGNVNGQAEVAFFLGGTQQTLYTRQQTLNVALLLGLIGTSTLTTGANNMSAVLTTNGSQAIELQYRSVDGNTITINERSLFLIRIA